MQRFRVLWCVLTVLVGTLLGSGCSLLGGETDAGGVVFTLEVNPNEAAVLDETQAVLAKRMSNMGTSLGQVVPGKPGQIEVLVPARLMVELDPGRLFDSIPFSVWEVDDSFLVPSSWQQHLIATNKVAGLATLSEMKQGLEGVEPDIGTRHVAWNVPDTQGKAVSLMVLTGDPILEANHIAAASAQMDDFGVPVVSLNLTSEGATRFADATKRLVGKRLAIITNGSIQSAPVIREPILGGQVQISLGATRDLRQALGLAGILAADPLPGTLRILDTQQVPPGTTLISSTQ